MLWPLILPVQLTFVLLAVIFFAALYVGQLRKWRQGRLVAGLFIGMPLMFIPSCLAVTTAVNHFRFGMFWYPDFASIQDFRNRAIHAGSSSQYSCVQTLQRQWLSSVVHC